MKQLELADAIAIEIYEISHFFMMAEVLEVKADVRVENVRLGRVATRLLEAIMCGLGYLLLRKMHPASLKYKIEWHNGFSVTATVTREERGIRFVFGHVGDVTVENMS